VDFGLILIPVLLGRIDVLVFFFVLFHYYSANLLPSAQGTEVKTHKIFREPFQRLQLALLFFHILAEHVTL